MKKKKNIFSYSSSSDSLSKKKEKEKKDINIWFVYTKLDGVDLDNRPSIDLLQPFVKKNPL